MSEKKKTTTTKKTTSKTSSAKAAPKKTTAAKKTTAKKSTTAKKTTTPKKTTTAKKTSTKKKSTTTAKKPAAKTTTKKAVKGPSTIKAQIVSYKRSNRLQTTNQAIAVILDDYNPKALVGKKFVINFAESNAIAKGIVVKVHGQVKNKRLRLRFLNAGMAGAAVNQIAEINI